MNKKEDYSIDHIPLPVFLMLIVLVPFIFMGHPTAIAIGEVGIFISLVLYGGILEIAKKLDGIKESIENTKNEELKRSIRAILQDSSKQDEEKKEE